MASEVPYRSYVNLRFGLRGGHLDSYVLGAYQMSATGDPANWHTGDPEAAPSVGSAMDLAIRARNTVITMNLLTRDSQPTLVSTCTYPLTGVACVSRVYTDLVSFAITAEGVTVRDIFGTTFADLQSLVPFPLIDGTAA